MGNGITEKEYLKIEIQTVYDSKLKRGVREL